MTNGFWSFTPFATVNACCCVLLLLLRCTLTNSFYCRSKNWYLKILALINILSWSRESRKSFWSGKVHEYIFFVAVIYNMFITSFKTMLLGSLCSHPENIVYIRLFSEFLHSIYLLKSLRRITTGLHLKFKLLCRLFKFTVGLFRDYAIMLQLMARSVQISKGWDWLIRQKPVAERPYLLIMEWDLFLVNRKLHRIGKKCSRGLL